MSDPTERTLREVHRLVQQMAKDIRAIRQAVAPVDERPASTRKKDPRKLYANDHG